jgi:prepilin-type N-terminal cleavage/methylation domain-containing protein
MKRGFTLIELLVVIAIIGILAALLFPTLSRAKARAVQIQCVSNYKQVGVALQLYLDESNDQLPPGKTTANYLDLTEKPAYNAETTNYLSYYLAAHLSSPSPASVSANTTAVVKSLACGVMCAPRPTATARSRIISRMRIRSASRARTIRRWTNCRVIRLAAGARNNRP